MSTAAIASTIAPGDAMTLIIALLIIISSLIQLMLMILRTRSLVILTGTLPLAAAASMSDWGQTWWRKHLGWLAAWLLYVSAFRLTQGTSLVPVLAGFMILILSVLILPALLRVIIRADLHRPPTPPTKGSSAPDADGGPSRAGVTTGGDPPSGSPSSSPAERRGSVPSQRDSSGAQPGPGTPSSGSTGPDDADSGNDPASHSQPGWRSAPSTAGPGSPS